MKAREGIHSRLNCTTPEIWSETMQRPAFNARDVRARLPGWAYVAVALTLVSCLGAQRDSWAQQPAANKAAQAAAANEVYVSKIVPFVKQYCLECHSTKKPEGGLELDRYKDPLAIEKDAKTWQNILEMISSSAMPPDDRPQPSDEQRKFVVEWIEQTIYRLDCDEAPDPGRVTIRRLNRSEYNNTVRDLLGITFRPADDFPSDDVGSGFDNQGDVLSLPPLLLEKYLAAAEKISAEAIITDPASLLTKQRAESDLKPDGGEWLNGRNGWGILSSGGVKSQFTIEEAGEYRIRVEAGAQNVNRDPAEMELRRQGKPLKKFKVVADRSKQKFHELTIDLPKGKLELGVYFTNDFYDAKVEDPRKRDRNLYVTAIEVVGPLNLSADDYPASHRQLLVALPNKTRTVAQAAQYNLRPLLQKAFRRRVTDAEVKAYVDLVDQSVQQGESFEAAMQIALQGVLVSPHFLFRVERDPHPNDPAQVHDLGQYELAARLSYFLWSSMPDDELFILATKGQLNQESVLKAQVQRMLSDPRAESLTTNFALQWLNLRLLDGTTPDPKIFGGFNEQLKADMRRETELFFSAIVREDRSILDFLQADFTFINERLANHYGMGNVSGDEFQRVSLAGQPRRGVLSHASVLTLTSNPERTSPVKRGKWILDNILGAPPPDPPPDVPQLDATQKAQPNLTLRRQLEIHRENAVCASCHKTMDQLGFGLENFDGVGRWREADGKDSIDPSGVLPGGDKFRGPTELIGVLAKRKQEFARCFTEKMMVYAFGRGLAPYDRCAAEKIVKAAEQDHYKISTVVTQIVLSDPFRKRRGDGGKP
jgi:mono/diheme cytochrome c family protein